MGYLTTVTFYNDAQDNLEKNPKEFAKAIFDAQTKANMDLRAADGTVGFHCNALTVQHSRHADDNTVYVHHGNTLISVNAYDKDFQDLAERLPAVAMEYVKCAEEIIKRAKKMLNEKRKSS